MSETLTKLNSLASRLCEESFLTNKGLSNEAGIHIFCYPPEDEFTVRAYINTLKEKSGVPYCLKECDLYEIFLEICEDKRILSRIPSLENSKGKQFLYEQLVKIATPESFVEKMKYEPHSRGDVLLITGVGKVFPFMRSHKILDNIQHIFADIPVVLLYPGIYTGSSLDLFGKFAEWNYYRAFDLL